MKRLLAVAVALALCACAAPRAPHELRIGHESDLLSLDPYQVRESATNSMLSNVFEGLVAFDRDMRLSPALAVSWSSQDDRTWVIELRPGVRFHDGRVLGASDVRHSLERARGEGSAVKGLLASVDRVEATGDLQVRIHTRYPDSQLLANLAYLQVEPAPSHRAGAGPIGTGPYRFESWQRGQRLELSAFAEYWGGRPAIPKVSFLPLGEAEEAVRALREGRVDVLRYVPESRADEVEALPGVRLLARPGLLTYYLLFDSRPGAAGAPNPLADRRVRQALSLAIDRAAILRKLQGRGLPAEQLVQPGVFGHLTGLPPLAYDPQRARALLAEAGHPGGFEITLLHRALPTVEQVVASLQGMLGAIGVRVSLQAPDWRDVVDGWQRARLPFFFAGWRFETGDAWGFFRDVIQTRDPARGSGTMNPGFSDPRIDRLIEENGLMLGEANRLRHYAELMRVAQEEMPIVPVYHRLNLYGVADRVRWEPRLDGRLLAVEMSLADTR